MRELHAAVGWEPVDWDAARTREWWRSWTASPHVSGAEFQVIARDADGSCVAWWLIDAVAPVVFLGADGQAALIAWSMDEYARLLASGVAPSAAPPQPSDFADHARQLHPGPGVRTARADDAPALQRLVATMGYDTPAAVIRERLRTLPLAHSVYVAVTDRVVGWVHVLLSHSLIVGVRGELSGLAVDESAQGAGAGTALLTAAERWAARHGAASMYVRSGSTRTGAHRFYGKCGYTPIKTQLALTKPL